MNTVLKKSLNNFLAGYSSLVGGNKPVIVETKEVNNVSYGTAYFGSENYYLRAVVDYKQSAFVFVLNEYGEEEVLDVIPFSDAHEFGLPTLV